MILFAFVVSALSLVVATMAFVGMRAIERTVPHDIREEITRQLTIRRAAVQFTVRHTRIEQ
jgi:hypothetical protein